MPKTVSSSSSRIVVDAETEAVDDDDESYDPMEFIDADDEF